MDFKFPIPRYQKPALKDMTFERYAVQEVTDEEKLPTMINGKAARSSEEARVAMALDKMGLRYIYQYPVFTGYLRGGYYIDFVIDYPPRVIPLEVQSERWHTGAFRGAFADDERLREAIIEEMFNEQLRYIWGDEAETIEMTYQSVRRVLNEPIRRRL